MTDCRRGFRGVLQPIDTVGCREEGHNLSNRSTKMCIRDSSLTSAAPIKLFRWLFVKQSDFIFERSVKGRTISMCLARKVDRFGRRLQESERKCSMDKRRIPTNDAAL